MNKSKKQLINYYLNKYKLNELQNFCGNRKIYYHPDDQRKHLAEKLVDHDFESSPKQINTSNSKENKQKEENTNYLAPDHYFLHINYNNLFNYFNKSCIYPIALEDSEIYKDENREKDILNEFEEYILLSKKPINCFYSSEVLVELVVDGDKAEKVMDDLYYYPEPIPISRIKNLYFKHDEAKKNFIAQSDTYPDCFIPRFLCRVVKDPLDPVQIDTKNLCALPKNTLSEWEQKLKHFNQILGMLAFLKNASILQAEKNGFLQTYSNGIFEILNHINSAIDVELENESNGLTRILSPPKGDSIRIAIFKGLVDSLYQFNSEFGIEKAIEIIDESLNEVVSEYPKNNEDLELKKIKRLFESYSKKIISYKDILANTDFKGQDRIVKALLLLAKFAKKSHGDLDNQEVRNAFINGNIETENIAEAEFLLGVLGFYYGYDKLQKKDNNLSFKDNTFDEVAQEEQSIKFKLDTYLDRFIVESVFKYAKEKQPFSKKFEFLDWSTDDNTSSFSNSNHSNVSDVEERKGYNYENQSFEVLKRKIIRIKRQEAKQALINEIKSSKYKIVPNSYLHLSLLIKEIDKEDIAYYLEKYKDSYKLDELKQLIYLDKLKN